MQLSEILCLVICLKLFAKTFGATAVGDITTLDEKKCSKARKGCCDNLHIKLDNVMAKCLFLHKDKIPPEDDKNLVQVIGPLSYLVECVYKTRNYLAEGDEDIDMQAVKEDVEKSYAGRPKEQQYYIELFELCRKEATKLYSLIKNNPASKVFFKKSCNLIYYLVYLCQVEYNMKTVCPYFVWEGKETTSAEQQCKSAKQQCYKIDGITPPEEHKYNP